MSLRLVCTQIGALRIVGIGKGRPSKVRNSASRVNSGIKGAATRCTLEVNDGNAAAIYTRSPPNSSIDILID